MTPAMPGTVPLGAVPGFPFVRGRTGWMSFPVRDGGDVQDRWDEGQAAEEGPVRRESRKAR